MHNTALSSSGMVQFAHKANGQSAYLEYDGAIPLGKVLFQVDYNFIGPGGSDNAVGTEVLKVNGKKVAERKIMKGFAAISTRNRVDGTDVGRDLRTAVSDRYTVPFAFTGKLKKVTITYSQPIAVGGTH